MHDESSKFHKCVVVGGITELLVGLWLAVVLMHSIKSLEHHESILHPFLVLLQMSPLGFAHMYLQSPFFLKTLAAVRAGIKI